MATPHYSSLPFICGVRGRNPGMERGMDVIVLDDLEISAHFGSNT